MTWKEIRLIFYTIAVAALTNLATARLFATLDEGGRINMEASGNIGNSNDLGTHLLLVMPFLIFVIIDRARSKVLRIPLVLAIAYGVWVVLGTGSRGCMLAMGAMFLFALWRATPAQRVGTLIVAMVLGVAVPLMLPGSVVTRLGSLFNEDQHREGRESAEAREYLLKQSLLYTFQHPLLGVGPGQFPNYEGSQRTSEGKRGQWKVTHNFLTEVSSECGIPALVFMLMSIGSALLLVNRTFRQARKRGFRDITNAFFCYQLGMIGYLCSVVFLAHAYLFYLPTMVGLAISMSLVAMRQMAAPQVQTVAAVPARF
jgi:O-antigen ligase